MDVLTMTSHVRTSTGEAHIIIRPIHIISLDAVELDVCYHPAFALPAEPHELWGVGEVGPWVYEEEP